MYKKIGSVVKKITRKSKSSFYYSFQILSTEKKDAIYSVYSFCRITDDIVDSTESKSIKEKKLIKWENDLRSALKNGFSADAVLQSLVKVSKKFSIPAEYFFTLIEGAYMDLQGTVYNTFDDLYKYCYKVASVVGFMSIRIFGYTNPKTEQYAENLGIALQLTNILRDVKKDADIGRIYIPKEDLVNFNVSEEDILKGIYTDNIKKLLQYQYDRAVGYYKKAEELLPKEDSKNLIASEIMGKTYWKLLQKIKKKQFDVFSTSIKVSEFRKKTIAVSILLKNLAKV